MVIDPGLLLVEAVENASPSSGTMISWLHPMSVGVSTMGQSMHCPTTSPSTLIVLIKETKSNLLIKGLFHPLSNSVRVFSIAHDLFNGHKQSTRRRRIKAAGGRNILTVRWREQGSNRMRNWNRFQSCGSQRHTTEGLNFYTWSMELQGILGRGGHFWETGRTNGRNRRTMTIGTMAQSILHMAEANPQFRSLSL